MKKAVFVVVGLLLFGVYLLASPFDDVPMDHWAYDAVSYLEQIGVLEGYPDGLYRGKRPLTRYELAMALARLEKRLSNLKLDEATKAIIEKLEREFAPELEQARKQLAQLDERVSALEEQNAELSKKVDELAKKKYRVNFSGGFGVLYKNEKFDPGLAFTKDLLLYQAYLNYDATVNPEMEVRGTLSTYTNGNTGYLYPATDNYWVSAGANNDWYDLRFAYLVYKPEAKEGYLGYLTSGTYYAGKMPPFWVTTELMYAPWNPVYGLGYAYEGENFYANLGFFTMAQDVVDEVNGVLNHTNQRCYLLQVGSDKLAENLNVAVGWHLANNAQPNITNAATAVAADYNALDVYANYAYRETEKPVFLTVHWVKDFSDQSGRIPDDNNVAFLFRLDYGELKNVGDWSAGYQYRSIGSGDSTAGFNPATNAYLPGNYFFAVPSTSAFSNGETIHTLRFSYLVKRSAVAFFSFEFGEVASHLPGSTPKYTGFNLGMEVKF